jgi:GntR family transcriptional regulator / MocR family aminotransferase
MQFSGTTLRRARGLPELPLVLDRKIHGQPAQLHASLRQSILEGRLQAGMRLPSTRSLALQIGLGRNAVIAAFEHLISDGLLETRPGSGTYVAKVLPERTNSAVVTPLVVAAVPSKPFALGRTHKDALILKQLGIATRRHILSAVTPDRGYADPRGNDRLRQQIAEQLRATRGIMCDASHIMLTSGTQHALRLCAEALLKAGDAVWFENPGYPASRSALTASGLKVVPVSVDGEGLVVAEGIRRAPRARAVYVTPSHQFPMGVPMSLGRRIELLDWARRSDAWIFEDDYDSEFRYAGAPLTALAGIDGGNHVVYLGTFSKVLFSSLRIAFAVLPPRIAARVVAARAAHDRFPPGFIEAGVADLMADGALAAHVRRMRSRYQLARDVVTRELVASSAGLLSTKLPAQGMHMVVFLPAGVDRERADAIRRAAGVEAWLVSETTMGKAEREGFVIGFAGHELPALAAAARCLGRATRELIG